MLYMQAETNQEALVVSSFGDKYLAGKLQIRGLLLYNIFHSNL
jgi:hypothetical protein